MKNHKNYLFYCFVFVFINLLQAQTLERLTANRQFRFLEGPAWDGVDAIYFSDIPDNKTHKYTLSTGTFSEVFSETNGANGLMFNADEELVMCESTALVKRSVTGSPSREVLADSFDGLGFGGVNDLCIDAKGGIYFSDPSTDTRPTTKVYYRNPSGVVSSLLDYGTQRVGGIILSPDGSKIYIVNLESYIIRRFDVEPDGSLTNGIDFATVTDPQEGTPREISRLDGLTVDSEGNIYAAAMSIEVFNPAGEKINEILMPNLDVPTNCTFGGVDKNILFITSRSHLYKIELPGVTGLRLPFDLQEPLSVKKEYKDSNEALKVFPNPLNGKALFLDLAKNYNIDSVIISDVHGKKVETPSFTINNKRVELLLSGNLSKGVYIISVLTQDGIRLNSKLII